MANPNKYSQAFDELESIVALLDRGEVGVDELYTKVKRAAELLRFCQEKLRNTEAEVKGVLDHLDGQDAAGPEAENDDVPEDPLPY